MPFILPKRVLRDGDLLKKEDFNADWQPVAELASGHLDSHNLDSDLLKPNVVVADGAFHKAYYLEQAVNPGWGDNTGYTVPLLATPPTDAWIVPITSNWTPVTPLQLTSITTGVSNLWIVAWAAYVYYGFSNVNNQIGTHAGTTAGNFIDAGLQLAIRVDGQILPETITGHTDDRYRPCEPLKPRRQRDSSAAADLKNAPGPGLFESHTIRGHGPQAGALRLVANAPVSPGTHSVELVARIVQKDNPLASLAVTVTGVGLHNRKLFVLDCPIHPAAAPTRTAVEVSALDDASVISAASLHTARNDVVADALNDVDAGHLARGAFTGRHLPNVPLDVSYSWITPTAPIEYDSKYPGYSSNTIAPSRTGLDTGWSWVLDTTGTKYLRTDSDLVRTPGDFITNGVDCLVIVMADVQLHEIDGGATSEAATTASSVCCFGSFGIAYQPNGGSVDVLHHTTAEFNNFTSWAYAVGFPIPVGVETNVPLFHVFNFSPNTGGTAGSLAGSNIDYVGVVCSAFRTAHSGGGAINIVPDVYCQRGALTVIQLRG